MNWTTERKLKIFATIAILLLVVGGATAYYFSVYSRTPDYAATAALNAIRTHNYKQFARYVDLDAVVDNGYDEFTSGILDTQNALSDEAVAVIKDFSRIIKNPLIAGFKTVVADYVETGNWENVSEKSDGIDTVKLVSRLGLANIEIKGISDIVTTSDTTATGKLKIYDVANEAEFTLDIVFQKNGDWRITSIENVHDYIVFISRLRRQKLTDYLTASGEIIAQHEKTIREADFEFQKILNRGSLGQDSTRGELKSLLEKTVLTDWEARKKELAALTVPSDATSLHKLRLRICDLNMSYAKGYADWMTDKKVSTLRAAEGELKQARTLEGEASILLKRMAFGQPVATNGENQ